MLPVRIVSFDHLPQALRWIILYAFTSLIFQHNLMVTLELLPMSRRGNRFRIGKDFAQGHTASLQGESLYWNIAHLTSESKLYITLLYTLRVQSVLTQQDL